MRTWMQHVMMLSAMLVMGGTAYAQNAQITGTLKDASGGVLPGATVTARNEETWLTRTAITEALGEYRVPALPPGRYTVSVDLQGFTTENRQNLILVIDQTVVLDFVLKPASLA